MVQSNTVDKKKKVIGIIGGMGPEATADIFTKIINLTPAEQDAEHIHILIDNNPEIPSRVKAILGDGESPLPELVKMAKSLEKWGADFLIMPCNTASYYIEEIRKEVSIPVMDIVEETSKYIFKKYKNHKIIGLLGTEMTVRLGLYQKALVKYGTELICKNHHCELVNHLQTSIEEYKRAIGIDVDKHYKVKYIKDFSPTSKISVLAPYLKSMKNLVMKAIYGKKGIKAGEKTIPKELMLKAIKELEHEGATVVILGCTEIPLVITGEKIGKIHLIDPTEILAKSAIELALGNNVFDINY